MYRAQSRPAAEVVGDGNTICKPRILARATARCVLAERWSQLVRPVRRFDWLPFQVAFTAYG
jgi:hypothetical protein